MLVVYARNIENCVRQCLEALLYQAVKGLAFTLAVVQDTCYKHDTERPE